MPYICSPDSSYVMDSAFELLEMTPDVPISAYLAGFNLDYYFDTYDAHYMREGASPAIKNLSNLMYDWLDNQDEKNRAIALSENIYSARLQFKELILGTTNKLITSFLNNKGIINKNNNFGFVIDNGFLIESEHANGLEGVEQLNIRSESDIYFPANIGSALINSNRSYEYILNIKNQLKKSFENDVPLIELQNHFKSLESVKNSFDINEENTKKIEKNNKKNIFNAKKALKKGVKKFSNLFGSSDIQSFISGDGFTVKGKIYNWNFKQRKNVSILSMTHSPISHHIPYVLTLMTKDNLEISNCCVYVNNNTPIIDQIITIMLYIQHDEEELLENCNLFNGTEEIFNIKENFNNKSSILYCQQNKNSINNHLIDSEYSIMFNNLNSKFLPIITEQFSSVLGIEKNFFKFLMSQTENPVLSGNRNYNQPYFINEFKNIKNLISV